MNIFVLHDDPVVAAQMMCDKHVVKMILESNQMLSTVAHKHGHDAPYRSTHAKHPCTLWTGESYENWRWLVKHSRALCEEYTHRYGKSHASARLKGPLMWAPFKPRSVLATIEQPYGFVLAMPDEYKSDDVFDSYQNYLMNEKQHFAKWEKDPSRKPTWWRT